MHNTIVITLDDPVATLDNPNASVKVYSHMQLLHAHWLVGERKRKTSDIKTCSINYWNYRAIENVLDKLLA